MIFGTWEALLRPRRAGAIVLAVLPLIYAQSMWNLDPFRGAASGVVLCAGTLLIAPASWRILSPLGSPGVILYGLIGAGTAWILAAPLPSALGVADRFLALPGTLPLVVGLYLVAGFGLGRDIDTEARLREEEARTIAMAREKERAELLAIRAQLDPHFLFNTLNALAEWCATDPAVAERGILGLADVLRIVLAATRAPDWPLAQELALCQKILDLHRLRDPERFAGSIEGTADVFVPPMILLPLVENAFKHGPAAGNRGPVSIRVARADWSLRIEVRNPGKYAGPRPGGQGIDMVRRRLELAYPGRAEFAIRAEGEGTVATIRLPGGHPERV